jgi:hypothetical protein
MSRPVTLNPHKSAALPNLRHVCKHAASLFCEVVPLVAGQRSVKEKEWLESFRVFGIGKDEGQKIIQRLGLTLLREHEKPFGSYWRHTFGPPSSLLQLLGKGISVRASQPPPGG